jgi:hypothetical protein
MIYHELEQFLGRGDEKFFWVLTYKNLIGLGVCGFLAHRIGTALFTHGPGVLLALALGLLLGVLLTNSSKGMMRIQRIVLLLRFLVRRAFHAPLLDSARLYTVVVDSEPLLRVRQRGGKALVLTRARSARQNGRHP